MVTAGISLAWFGLWTPAVGGLKGAHHVVLESRSPTGTLAE